MQNKDKSSLRCLPLVSFWERVIPCSAALCTFKGRNLTVSSLLVITKSISDTKYLHTREPDFSEETCNSITSSLMCRNSPCFYPCPRVQARPTERVTFFLHGNGFLAKDNGTSGWCLQWPVAENEFLRVRTSVSHIHTWVECLLTLLSAQWRLWIAI